MRSQENRAFRPHRDPESRRKVGHLEGGTGAKLRRWAPDRGSCRVLANSPFYQELVHGPRGGVTGAPNAWRCLVFSIFDLVSRSKK